MPARDVPERFKSGDAERLGQPECAHSVRCVGSGLVGEDLGHRLRVLARRLVDLDVAEVGRGYVGAELRHDRDQRVLVLQVDRELELLLDVVRLELQRALGGAQRPVEVAELAQREAEVVVRRRVPGIGLDGPREGVLRVAVPAQFADALLGFGLWLSGLFIA